jgi:hypothetical protein
VDLPEDESDSSFDGRHGKVAGTNGKSAVNALQGVSAAETKAAASLQQTPTGDPPLHIWHRGLIAAVVNTVLYDTLFFFFFFFYSLSACNLKVMALVKKG